MIIIISWCYVSVLLCQSDDDGLDLEEVVNSAFRHLREDLTRRSATVKSSQQSDSVIVNDAVSITRHVTQTSNSLSVKVSKLPQSHADKLPTKAHDDDSSVVKAHRGKYF